MSRIYLPRAEQLDLMNENLAKIANALASNIDLSTWAGIQKAVRVGVAPDLIPVGTQLTVRHSVYGEKLYDVVAHNHFKSAHDENAHTMTLMCHDTIAYLPFDSKEAFYYVDKELPAGTYNFTLATAYESWAAGTYQFTLKNPVPAGGQLGVGTNAEYALTQSTVLVYASQISPTSTEQPPITMGSEGTSLGTFGVELNHAHRVSYGSNNYKESFVRQFLNSSAEAGEVWHPQTKFDRPRDGTNPLAGFLNGLDSEFLAVIGAVIVPCSANDNYESPDSTTVKGGKYTVTDKFYLASQKEVLGTNVETVEDDSVLLPYYKNATNADRIKYRDGAAEIWWGRSPTSWHAGSNRVVYADGSLGNYYVANYHEFVPICNIV